MTYTPNLSKITKEEIVTLPVESFPGHIVVVDRPEEVGQAVRILSASRCVGFDTETRPSFKKNQHHKVALMQLSTENVCYLFRLNHLGGIPEPLIAFLKDERITKIGLSLPDDFHMMRERVKDRRALSTCRKSCLRMASKRRACKKSTRFCSGKKSRNVHVLRIGMPIF